MTRGPKGHRPKVCYACMHLNHFLDKRISPVETQPDHAMTGNQPALPEVGNGTWTNTATLLTKFVKHQVAQATVTDLSNKK